METINVKVEKLILVQCKKKYHLSIVNLKENMINIPLNLLVWDMKMKYIEI